MEKKAKFEVSGEVIEIGETQVFSSGFTKRELVVEASKNEQYPSPVKLTFKKDDCSKLDALNVGDGVEVTGFVEGREWDGPKGKQYFVDLTAKSVMVTEKADPKSVKHTATDWSSLLAVASVFGEDEASVKKRCEDYKSRNKITAKFTASDWQKVADELAASNGGSIGASSSEAEQDEMPF